MIINMNGGVEDEKNIPLCTLNHFAFSSIDSLLFLALVVGVSFVMFKKIYVDDVLFCLPSHKL